MAECFPQPPPADGTLLAYRHDHEMVEVGASRNPNGTWSSVWACELCPDVFLGGYVGPIPAGFCHRCHWVQLKPNRKKCEGCKSPLVDQPPRRR